MGVKYVKDFSYPKHMGFHSASGKMSKYAEGGRVPGYDMDRLPAKKPPGRTMDLAPSKPEKGEYQGYAKGGIAKGKAKIAKVMGEYKRGKLHSGSKKGPKVKSREQAVAIALSEARKAGAKIPKKAEGGVMGGPTSYAESGSAGGSKISFKDAFRAARKQGLEEFTWRGDRYTTKLKEETKQESKAEEKAPKAEAARKGPESRGVRKVSDMSEVKRERKMTLPSDRATDFRSQAEETGMSPEERAETARGYALGIASMAPVARLAKMARGLSAAGRGSRTGQVGVRGMTMAQRERDAAAAKAAEERVSALRKTAEARSRMGRGSVYADGGLASKGPSTRYTPPKGRREARERAQQKWAEQRMRHAEKYAPGMSLDMKAKGGLSKHQDVEMDKSMIRSAVHKHESAMHPGKPKTKLRHGGMLSYGRKPMYGGGK